MCHFRWYPCLSSPSCLSLPKPVLSPHLNSHGAYLCTRICKVNAKSGLFSEKHLSPVILGPYNVISGPLETCLHFVAHQWNANCRSSTNTMELVSNGLSKNQISCCILEVIMEDCGIHGAMTSTLYHNKTVFQLHCSPLTTSPMCVNNISIHLKVFLHPCDHSLWHTKDVPHDARNSPLQASQFPPIHFFNAMMLPYT